MENRVVEFGNCRRVIPEMLQRIRSCEQRGARFAPGKEITDEMLEEFEKRGTYKVTAQTEPRMTLSPQDRERISKRLRDDYELEQYRISQKPIRDARRKQIENELTLKKLGLCMIPQEKTTNIYL